MTTTKTAVAAKRPALKLNARGKVVASLLAAGLAWGGVSLLTSQTAESAPTATEVTSYIVQPGDTLWGYASSITDDDHDVSETVATLMKLNNLDSAALHTGQRIVVPVTDDVA